MTAEDKLKQLILYILQRISVTQTVGAERTDKLRQMLFESDHLAYIKSGTDSVTGLNYTIQDGEPAPLNFATILDDMKTAGDIADHNSFSKATIMAQTAFNDALLFGSEEQHCIARVMYNNIRTQSFALTGHEAVTEGNTIPYGSMSIA